MYVYMRLSNDLASTPATLPGPVQVKTNTQIKTQSQSK